MSDPQPTPAEVLAKILGTGEVIDAKLYAKSVLAALREAGYTVVPPGHDRDNLQEFCDWLEFSGLIKDGDDRTTDDLVDEYLGGKMPRTSGACPWHEEEHRRVCMSEHAAEVGDA